MEEIRPMTLSIGGWDPCAGAGLAADIKTFEINQVTGMGICSAITCQAHNRFDSLEWTSVNLIDSQLSSLLSSYSFKAAKFGIVESLDVVELCVNRLLEHNPDIHIIWDPVLKASAGYSFHNDVNNDKLFGLLRKIDLLTPNKPEAEFLFGTSDARKIQDIVKTFELCAVLLKGGHSNDNANDLLINCTSVIEISGERFNNNPGKHGSGCVLSAAICAQLAKGKSLKTACGQAKRYVERFILSSNHLLGKHFSASEVNNQSM
jgi:hydroxymethylpyrimidine/phosphomethylpyrimidine kinase